MKTFGIFIISIISVTLSAISQTMQPTQPVQAYVASVWSHDKDVTDSLRLDYKTNNLRFYLNNRQHLPLDTIQYQVMLTGFDDTWRAPGEPGWTWYPELKPGSYKFMVRCRYKGAEAWGPPSTHHFTILTPWWKSSWAISGYIIIITALALWIAYLIRTRIKSYNALIIERENSRYRNNFVVHAASEFRTPLSVIRSTIEKLSPANRELSGADVRILRHSLAQLLQGIERMASFDESISTESTAIEPEPIPTSDANTSINSDVNIMVAEPDFHLANLVRCELQPLFNVILATGSDLFKQVQANRPNVLVIDTGLRGIDAFNIAKRIKSDPYLNNTTIIMTSDFNSSRSLLKLVQSDADDFLNKPYDMKVLIAMVIKHLRKTHVKTEQPKAPVSTTVVRDQADNKFIEDLNKVINDGMTDCYFGVNEIQQTLGISRVKLYERIKTLKGMTPLEYLRNARLNRAAELLLNPDMSVKEIRVAVGMPDATSFHRHFRNRFATTPKEYRSRLTDNRKQAL